MKQVTLGQTEASAVALGCMRLAGKTVPQVQTLIHTALECGITLFDHADIYGGGSCETLFGRVLAGQPGLRDRMILQSKCGIRRGFYDFSCGHIVSSVEGILSRLQTDRLDLLLLHRPDALAEQEEFARAVQTLKAQGKVLQFGVSNMNPAQLQLLESWCGEPLVADQLQLSLMHAGMVTSGMNVNVGSGEGILYDGGVLPFCQRRGITVQAWSPLQYGMFEGCFVGNGQFPALNACLGELAQRYGVTPAAVALAWILRIPGRMQVILGTADPAHVREAAASAGVELTREDWYALYRSCSYPLP